MQSDNILKDAIAEARTLRKLSMSNARHSLVKFLKEEKLPLDDLADAELDLDHFVDLIMKRSREREKEDDKLNAKGLPYRRKRNKDDDELEERSRYSDDDEFEIDYGDGNIEKSGKNDDDEKEDEDNFSDNVIDERIHKWQNLYGRRNFKSSPAIISSGVGSTKLSQNERNILLKHAGLIKENREFKRSTAIKDDLIRQRAGIKNSNRNIAQQVVNDLEIKKRLTK